MTDWPRFTVFDENSERHELRVAIAESVMNSSDQRSEDDFLFFSQEYSQALEAYRAIERQAATLITMGSSAELRDFIDQFVAMAKSAAAEAESRKLENFPEWFHELAARAQSLGHQAKKQ